MMKLEGHCFAGARNLCDLDGGLMGINHFVGTFLTYFLVDWIDLPSIVLSRLITSNT